MALVMRRLKAACLVFWLASAASAQQRTIDVEVPGNGQWKDTGLEVQPGDSLRFAATGTLQFAGSPTPAGASGLTRGWKDLIRISPMSDAGRGAVIGRIGDSAAARPFLVGEHREVRVPMAGKLFLATNLAAGDTCEGNFKVNVVWSKGAAASSQPYTGPLPKLTEAQLNGIARRVIDKDGNVGDRTNFIIFGSEQKVRQALEQADWVIVDKNVKDTFLRGALATLNKQAYVTIPMSELYLFDRPQDFGYAQADPLMVVASRHHFRIWKAPFTADGQTVWVGAGTHDIGFDRDQRNNNLTHKIDPDTDKERDYIAESLKQTGMVVKTEYMTPANPITKAKTAHGEEFFSDGRTMLIWLVPDAAVSSAKGSAFGDYFCSVLAQSNPDTGQWGDCSRWIQEPGRADMKLGTLPSDKYRLLIVPGIMNTCVSSSPAFSEGQQVLTSKYGWTVELLNVPNNTCEDNAKEIAAYLSGKLTESPKKYILIGYSKGTPDIQVMLAQQPGAASGVAAFISVAGASGGSPIADSIPAMADQYMDRYKVGNCKGDMSIGLSSLKQDVRKQFLESYPQPVVPTYSVVAVADPARLSKAMMGSYRLMAVYDKLNDGQLTRQDAMIPGSQYLGAMITDHLSVALPLQKGSFPRAALLEALLRYVTADLAAKGN
jgi:hypothetical protein